MSKSRYVLVEEEFGTSLHNTGQGNINYISMDKPSTGNYFPVRIGYKGQDKPRVQSFTSNDKAKEFINLLIKDQEVVKA